MGKPSSAGSSGTAHRARAVTYNLWARHGDWEARRAVLAKTLRALQPDVLALQEAVVTDGYDYPLVRGGIHGPTLEAAACERILDQPVNGVWASDHFGLYADFVVPQESTSF